MKTILTSLGCVVLLLAACGDESAECQPPVKEKAKPAEAKKVLVGKNVTLEVQDGKRRVVVDAVVCFREGPLELFLCRRYTKEHEAILSADADARDIHKALLLAGAEPGAPARFRPTFKSATGPVIQITIEYQDQGNRVSLPAQKWVRNLQTKKDLEHDWVFAGSVLVPNPLEPTQPPAYAANAGDIICLSNFEGALLDVNARSSDADADRVYEANTARIPALETKVRVILEPKEKLKK